MNEIEPVNGPIHGLIWATGVMLPIYGLGMAWLSIWITSGLVIVGMICLIFAGYAAQSERNEMRYEDRFIDIEDLTVEQLKEVLDTARYELGLGSVNSLHEKSLRAEINAVEEEIEYRVVST